MAVIGCHAASKLLTFIFNPGPGLGRLHRQGLGHIQLSNSFHNWTRLSSAFVKTHCEGHWRTQLVLYVHGVLGGEHHQGAVHGRGKLHTPLCDLGQMQQRHHLQRIWQLSDWHQQ